MLTCLDMMRHKQRQTILIYSSIFLYIYVYISRYKDSSVRHVFFFERVFLSNIDDHAHCCACDTCFTVCICVRINAFSPYY